MASNDSPCKQAIRTVVGNIIKFSKASEWLTFIETCSACSTWKTRILNMKNKSQRIQYKGVDVNIPFNCFGFPIFDDFIRTLPNFEGFLEITYDKTTTSAQDTKAATDKLKSLYPSGNYPFTTNNAGNRVFYNGEWFTWHHHEDTKKMLLIPTEVHLAVGHKGGRFLVESDLNDKMPGFRSRLNCN